MGGSCMSRIARAVGSMSLLFLLSLAPFGVPAKADEGMWTFDNPPLAQLKEKYGFTPTPAWLDHLRMSSVRFNDGGSGVVLRRPPPGPPNHPPAFRRIP